MDWTIIGGIAGIVSLGLVVFAGGRYIGKLDELVRRHVSCPIITVDKEASILKARFDMFLSTIEKHIPNDLIAPHTPHRDDLLRKMSKGELTLDETKELLTDMELNIDSFKSDKLLAAILVIVRLKDKINGWS